LSEEEQRLPVAAAHISDRAAGAQRGIHLRHGGDPVLHQVVAEAGTREALEATPEGFAIPVLRYTAPMLKRID
jgi:hypothetical protein